MGFLSLPQTAAVLGGFWLFSSFYSLHVNRQHAKRTGLPYVYTAIYEWSVPWLLLREPAYAVLKILGLAWLVKYSAPSWNFKAKYAVHRKLGDIFLVVSPGGISVFVADPDVVLDMVKRRSDFPRPVKSLVAVMGYYGPSILASEHDEWKFHRRVTNKTFTESSHQIVWQESLMQGEAMKAEWLTKRNPKTSDSNGIIFDLGADCMKLALNVVMTASFGVNAPWDPTIAGPPPGYKMTIREAGEFILEHIQIVAIFPRWLFKYLPFEVFKRAQVATDEFEKYMAEIREHAEAQIKEGKEEKNLMSAMLRADDPETGEKPLEKKWRKGGDFVKDFVFGNSFIFLLAGHETTARSLQYALFLFAMHPEYQQEVYDEIDEAIEGAGDILSLQYDVAFPKLTKTNAVLYEATRLYPVTPYIPKSTEDTAGSTFTYQGKDRFIPGNSMVALDAIAMHHDPRHWVEPDRYLPKRWYNDKGNGNVNAVAHLYRRGAYLGYAEGPRACPGKRFAQVEILATFVALFHRHRIELVGEPGESAAETLARAKRGLENSKVVITLNLFDQPKVRLVPRK